MPVSARDIKILAPSGLPTFDSGFGDDLGGGPGSAYWLNFCSGVAGALAVVSDNPGDTNSVLVQRIRSIDFAISNEFVNLNGQTPVPLVDTNVAGVASVSYSGGASNVALIKTTPERTGTAQGGATDRITLDAGATASDYLWHVVRITAGTGAGQINLICDGVGEDAITWFDWGTPPDATSVFEVSKGIFLPHNPFFQVTVQSPVYGALANPAGGSTRIYYSKMIFQNTHPSDTLTSPVVKKITDTLGVWGFGLPSAINDTDVAADRRTAPAGVTFDSADKNSPSDLGPNDYLGVWMRLTLPAGTLRGEADLGLRLEGDDGT